MIERRRIWTDNALADYIRDELGFPGARQGAMVEKETVAIPTGEVGRERWYLLTSLSSFGCGPRLGAVRDWVRSATGCGPRLGAVRDNCSSCSATTGALRTACIT